MGSHAGAWEPEEIGNRLVDAQAYPPYNESVASIPCLESILRGVFPGSELVFLNRRFYKT